MTWYDFARVVVKYFFLPFHPIEIVGAENLPAEGPVIICSNHTSNLDPFFISYTYKRDIRYMAKKELFMRGPVGYVVRSLKAIPVDRGSNDMSAIRTSLAALKDGDVLGIFPEGHRFRDGKMHEFQNGVSLLVTRSKAPVVPYRLITDYKLFHKVRVVIGKPFTYQLTPGLNGSEQLSACTKLIYDKISELK